MQLATHIANPVSVIATRILDVTDITDRSRGVGQSSPDLMLRLADGRNYTANSAMTSRHVPVAGDYLVTQEDGYEYLNPKEVFERKYAAITTPAGDAAIEQAIQANGLTAPRVTPAEIEANIAETHYFTASDGVLGQLYASSEDGDIGDGGAPVHLSLLTFCVLVLRNGFTVTGDSACASPENFNAEIGRKIARENAINKIWPLLGYALKDRLHRDPTFHRRPNPAHGAPQPAGHNPVA